MAKKLNALFWGLKCERGWLQYGKRVLIEDNRPGNGIVLHTTKKDAVDYKKTFDFGQEWKPVKVRIRELS